MRRTVQVHPTQFCNYSCLHCYSSSSPAHTKHLPTDHLLTFVEQAVNEGFQHLSVSGGEPLLYKGITELLTHARQLGMQTSLITNGSFTKAKYERFAPLVDSVGVSLDGLENLHDQIRNHPGAFKKVERFLGFAKDLFASVGMVVSISDQSWEAIPELLDLARDKQVDLVQLHPMEPAGRAVEHHKISLSNVNLKRAYLLYRALAPDYPFSIAFDAFTRQAAAKLLVPKESTTKMAESVDLIVVTEEGAIKPHSYQAPPEWTLGNLLYDDLPSCWENYRTHQLEAYGLWVKDQLGKVESPIFSPDRPFSVALEQ